MKHIDLSTEKMVNATFVLLMIFIFMMIHENENLLWPSEVFVFIPVIAVYLFDPDNVWKPYKLMTIFLVGVSLVFACLALVKVF